MCKAHSKVTHKTAKIFSSPISVCACYTDALVMKIFFAVLYVSLCCVHGTLFSFQRNSLGALFIVLLMLYLAE